MFDQETPDPGRRESLLTESSTSFRRPVVQGLAIPKDVVSKDIVSKDVGEDSVPEGESSEAVPVPKTVGPFTIVETLGTGAMGEVYLARDQRLERWVALKRIQPSRYGRESVLRFRREARAAAKLHHRSIVQVHDLLETEESDWLVMERLEGESLADRLQNGPIQPLEALHIAIRIGEGLAAAHDAGVMHRDLKASNIMLTPNGVKILDFGLAKTLPDGERKDTGVTSEGQLIGTISSMAPEQAKGLDVDQRADLFAFGMLLFEMLTGASPFKRRSALATMNAICDEDAPSLEAAVPEAPSVLVSLMRQLLAKDPGDRPAGGAPEVVELLRQARVELGGSSAGHYSAVATGRRNHRRRLFLFWIPLVLLVLALFGWFGRRQQAPSTPLRLVVAHFDYTGGDGHRYFAQGLAEEIRSRLSALKGVRVVRPLDRELFDSELFDPGAPPTPLGDQADYLLEGAVLWPADGSQRLSVQLHLTSRDGTINWTRIFDEPTDDLVALQVRLANEVAALLPIDIKSRERASIQLQGTFNQAAYLAYLEGRDWERRTRFNREHIRHALEAYRRAVEHDGLFIDAHARLIRFETMDYLNRARSQERKIDVLRNLNELKDLAPDQPATWLAAAEVAYRVENDYARATIELERVLELEPGNAEALSTLGYVLRRQGRFEEAVEVFAEVAALTPYDAEIPADIAETLRALRQFSQANEYYRISLGLAPSDGWVRGQAALCLFEAQDCAPGTCDVRPALALLDEAPDLDDEAVRLHRFWLLAANARDGDAEALAAALDHLPGRFEAEALALVSFPGRAAALRALGREQELQERAAELVTELDEALELGELYPTSRVFLAIALALSPDPSAIDKARGYAEEAMRLAIPDQFSGPRTMERWAMALALGGQADEARQQIDLLIDKNYQRAITRQSLRLDPIWLSLRSDDGL